MNHRVGDTPLVCSRARRKLVANSLETSVDIVLGVSLTPKTVRMVLVEGEKGDGEIVDHDTFDVSSSDGAATNNAADQVVAAVLGTQESAAEGGHVLKAIGVTWSDRAEAADVREALYARGIRDVILVSELHAAGALAQAVGRAVGYTSTAFLFIDRDSATLSVVRSDDGSIVKVLGTSLHSTDAMAVLGDMAAAVDAQESPPDGMFVVGSGVDIASVKEHLQSLVALPVRAPDESSLALARGAALAAAGAPAFEATTAGLAYSLDPDGPTAGNEDIALANAATVLGPVGGIGLAAADYGDVGDYPDVPDPAVEEGRKPFLLVGSALASVFVVGVVALVISLAVNIRPTVDQRPDAAPPLAPAAPPAAAPQVPEADVPEANVPAPAPAPPPAAPAPETIKAPVPVVQEAPQAPRQVYVEPPAAPAPAPAPAAPAPAPAAPVVPAPIAPAPAPVYNPPGILPSLFPPIWRPPVYQPPRQSPWNPNPWPQTPPQQDDDWPQWPPRNDDDDWPQAPQWPGQGGGGGGSEAPQWPGQGGGGSQAPQWPGQSGGRGGGYPGGGGNGGYPGGGGGGGAPNCFLIFCS